MPSISFIIPTYNGLNLLKRCLKSIEDQIEKSDKIIIINDGSIDGTKEFLNDNYAKKSNIFVLNQENSGSGPARNAGLSYSDTDYVWFIDSDDYIKSNSVKLIKERLLKSKNDVLFLDYEIKKKESKKRYKLTFNPQNIYEVLLSQHYPWNKVIKRSLFNDIKFPNKKIRYQDVATIPRVLLSASNIDILHEAVYIYDFSHSQNITKDLNKEKDIFTACDYLVKSLQGKYYNELELILFHLFVFNRIYFSPKNNPRTIYHQLIKIEKYLNKNVPYWKKSRYFKFEFGRKYNKFIPFLRTKILLGRIFKFSTKIMTLVVFSLLSIKPFLKN